MDLDNFSLLSFIAISETGSFTKAAKRVGRTQSAISQQIARLENFIGKQLVTRGKKVTLTTDGEIFLSYAKKIFSLQCEAIDRFKEPTLEGEVRIGVPEDFASLFLSDILADFSRVHPRILLNIECDLTINLLERFRKSEFDLVLLKLNSPEDFPNGIDVWSEPLRWVGSFEELNLNEPTPLVLSPAPCVYRAAAIEALEKSGKSWRAVLISPSYAGKVAAVKAGLGITVMPANMIADDLEAITSSYLPQLSHIHASLLKQRADIPAVNSLEAFIVRMMN